MLKFPNTSTYTETFLKSINAPPPSVERHAFIQQVCRDEVLTGSCERIVNTFNTTEVRVRVAATPQRHLERRLTGGEELPRQECFLWFPHSSDEEKATTLASEGGDSPIQAAADGGQLPVAQPVTRCTATQQQDQKQKSLSSGQTRSWICQSFQTGPAASMENYGANEVCSCESGTVGMNVNTESSVET
ncbi:unnamed protein product [Pleuronectes platessa]|uniref:Uncharacterized protein n=1 Tax=Pleuronectes platessa TaxID=8262 RepID=A0A9N7U828_PLEPL|nr:unnamed protein product [Pleuronectes platessa]